MAVATAKIPSFIKKCQTLNCTASRYYSTSEKRGLVLGAYTEKGQDGVQLTEAAKNFDAKVNGKLIQHLNLLTKAEYNFQQ